MHELVKRQASWACVAVVVVVTDDDDVADVAVVDVIVVVVVVISPHSNCTASRWRPGAVPPPVQTASVDSTDAALTLHSAMPMQSVKAAVTSILHPLTPVEYTLHTPAMSPIRANVTSVITSRFKSAFSHSNSMSVLAETVFAMKSGMRFSSWHTMPWGTADKNVNGSRMSTAASLRPTTICTVSQQ
jgi:hypothetical protein